MIKKIILVLSILLVLSVKNVKAEEFIKSENNPLTITQNYPDWIEKSQRQPFILFDENKYKLWYSSDNESKLKIGYAESNDLKNWNGIQLLNLNNNENNQDPHVIKNNGNYTLYYSSSINGGNYKIHKIDSNDGKNFDYSTDTIILTPSQSWENRAVSSPFVTKIDSKYYLFYSGWNGYIWKIGLAISNDGITWNKCNNNPITSSGSSGPYLIQKDNKLFLFFHNQTATKISYIESTNDLSCNTIWSQPKDLLFTDKPYDMSHLTDPSLFIKNDITYLFYSGQNTNGLWTVNYAQTQKEEIEKPTIVFIPGFMTSWNKNAIIYNENVSLEDWKIPDFIKEYTGLFTTLNNLGFIENENYFIFTYDWRKNIDLTINNLNVYLQNKIWNNSPNKKVYIIGHSLGGLIGRIYTQMYPEKVEKIISVGAPNYGSPSVYKAIQAGEIEPSNNFLYLAQNMILNLYRDKYLTNKDTVTNAFPVLIDIYPTYNFLYDANNNVILNDAYNIKNNYLILKNLNIGPLLNSISSIYGIKGQTLFGFKVKQGSIIDSLLGNYIDGVPEENKYEIGDLNIPSTSSIIGNINTSFNFDHEELIYKKTSIKKILDLLNLSYSDDKVEEGERTIITPSILLIIKSPAVIELLYNDKLYEEKNGLIFIENADYGNYKLKVKGVENGAYTVLIGFTDEQNSNWFEINGNINSNNPSSYIDEYNINFKENDNSIFPINDASLNVYFNELIYLISNIKNNIDQELFLKLNKEITLSKDLLNKNKYALFRLRVLSLHKNLFKLLYQKPIYNPLVNKAIKSINLIEELYIKALINKNVKLNKKLLLIEIKTLLRKELLFEKKLNELSKLNIDITYGSQLLSLAQKKINIANETLKNENLINIYIYLKSSKLLLNTIQKYYFD